jgi:hypothetical protein
VDYDPPPNPLNTFSPADALATMGDGQARGGANSLSSYLEEVRGETGPLVTAWLSI